MFPQFKASLIAPQSGYSSLIVAALNGHLKAVQLLVDRVSDVDAAAEVNTLRKPTRVSTH